MEQESDPLLIGIEASTEGDKALQAFFAALPSDPGAAVVVFPADSDPQSGDRLAGRLASLTDLPIRRVESEEVLRKNHVYVIPSGYRLRVANHAIFALPLASRASPGEPIFHVLPEPHDERITLALTGAEPATNDELKLKLESVTRAHSDLQNLMAATDFGTLFLDPLLRIKRFTPRLTELFNITAGDEGRPITDFTHQLDYDELAAHALAVLRDIAPMEHEVKSKSGGWYLVRIRPYRTIDDRVDGVVATFLDITERRRAEEALRHSEERLRQEMRLVELSRAPIFVWDFDDGIVQWNRGSEELYGYTRQEASGQVKENLLQTEVPGSSFADLRKALLANGAWSGEVLHRAKDGRVLTIETRIELFSMGKRRLALESARDVTDQKKWEERRRLLLNELSHRVRNTLTVVQSMARQTLRTTKTSAEFVERFEGRLAALARAHKLLVKTHWEGAELGDMVRSQLEAYISSDPQRLRIEGLPITLPPDVATPFGLVLHELATNAAKYGAFSVAKGQVSLSWHLKSENSQRHVAITWEEYNGPPVKAPAKQGFGGKLILNGVPGAKVHRDFAASGLVCTIEFALPEAGLGNRA